MLYHLLYPLADDFAIFNLFRYITFRTGGAIMTALIIGFVIGPAIIKWLKKKQGEGQPIRTDGPETHLKKQGTPTMGGLMILISVTISTLIWVDITSIYMWVTLFVFIGFGMIGFVDDYKKLTSRSANGLPGKIRLSLEFLIAALAIYVVGLEMGEGLDTWLSLPFLKNTLINLSYFFLPFTMLVVVGCANAVNITDGLDGLAIMPVVIAAFCFGIIAYLWAY